MHIMTFTRKTIIVRNYIKKNNGEYFLFGYGRSESRYALHPNQKSKYGIGSDITPLSDSEAIEWMIEYSRGTYNRIYRHKH